MGEQYTKKIIFYFLMMMTIAVGAFAADSAKENETFQNIIQQQKEQEARLKAKGIKIIKPHKLSFTKDYHMFTLWDAGAIDHKACVTIGFDDDNGKMYDFTWKFRSNKEAEAFWDEHWDDTDAVTLLALTEENARWKVRKDNYYIGYVNK